MSIFDIFNFKAAVKKIITAENITLLKAVVKEKIIEMVKKNIPGQEKMDQVVATAIDFIQKHMSSKNKIVQWCIDNLLIKNIRLVAQSIYDDLKDIVEGL